MQKISWNDDLATLAQNWMNQCMFQHESNRINRSFPDLSVGQNLGYFERNRPYDIQSLFRKVIKMWFEEYKYFPPDFISPYQYPYKITQDIQTGHFTQMVWANTNQVKICTVPTPH